MRVGRAGQRHADAPIVEPPPFLVEAAEQRVALEKAQIGIDAEAVAGAAAIVVVNVVTRRGIARRVAHDFRAPAKIVNVFEVSWSAKSLWHNPKS